MMKKLMLLGGAKYLLPYINVAHELGAYVITCDYLPGNLAHKYSDEYADVSIVDKEAVFAKAKALHIDGIMSPATDPGVTTAAYVAEKMGLPGVPYESAEILQHKDRFRKFLRENGFNAPRSESFSNVEEAISAAKTFQIPFIIKPTDSAGSKGVTEISSYEQVEKAVKNAFDTSICKNIIIESFIKQKGHSTDTDSFSINDELVFCSFNCQHFDPEAVNPYTPSAYTWPSDMPDDIQKQLRADIQRVIKLLHLGSSLYNIETRQGTDGKPYIMELAPRAGGNRLAEMLKYASGQDLVMNAVKAALGMELTPMTDPVYNGSWAEYIIHSNIEGNFENIDIDPAFEKEHVKEKDIWVKPGDHVYTFTGANRAIGTLVLQFQSQEEAERALADINKYVKVNLS